MHKKYAIDTNVLIDDENAIEILRNGDENEIYIPQTVIRELDGLKKDNRLKHRVQLAIDSIVNDKKINILKKTTLNGDSTNDDKIINEIHKAEEDGIILISNDKLMRLNAELVGVNALPYEQSSPFQSESEKYTGFISLEEQEEFENNCFYWSEGKLHYNSKKGEKLIDYENELWGVKPRSPYQNSALELMIDENIDLVTVQSEAGFGKTFISLAAALYLTLERKDNPYRKIYVVKPNIEIGSEIGFLPGDVDEKLGPYFRPIRDLALKLHDIRPANRIFDDATEDKLEFNSRKFEMMPINFMRGLNIENAVVIIDEIQNLSRSEARTVLSRMGEGVKCICLGDVKQIDNIHLNQENNGLNWIVKKMKGHKKYGHMVLKGTRSRGPIADMIRERKL